MANYHGQHLHVPHGHMAADLLPVPSQSSHAMPGHHALGPQSLHQRPSHAYHARHAQDPQQQLLCEQQQQQQQERPFADLSHQHQPQQQLETQQQHMQTQQQHVQIQQSLQPAAAEQEQLRVLQYNQQLQQQQHNLVQQQQRRLLQHQAQSYVSNERQHPEQQQQEYARTHDSRHLYQPEQQEPQRVQHGESTGVALQQHPVTVARPTRSVNGSVHELRRLRAAKNAEQVRTFFTPTLGSSRYVAERFIGEGAYGVVISAKDRVTGDLVAIKRIRKCLNNHPMFTRALRELKFLRLLSPHKNIIKVRDVLLPGEREKFNDTFVVCEQMPTDLKKVLEGTTEITPDHIKYFMFQLLCGVHYMHSANVFHRDLKPSNILINEKCELRICDFGLARASYESGPDTTRFWTDYVATRWYRAPELIMEDHSSYSTAIDMWSVGCIFAEILSGGKVLFQGTSKKNMFELITDVLGSPPRHVLDRLRNQSDRRILSEFLHPHRKPRDLSQMFPTADFQAINLLSSLLVLDQDERISAWDALHHPYFAQYWYLRFGEEASPLPASEFQFERATLTHDQMRHELLKEILHYHPNETISALANYGIGDHVLLTSPVQNFVHQVDVRDIGARIRGTTLPEQTLSKYTGGQGRPEVPLRQHGTMTESELALFSRSRIPRHSDV
jgi:serine/threonine protein kinase